MGRRCPFKKEKKKVGDLLFLPLSGHRGEGGIWTASAGNHAEMVWAFVRVRGSTTSFQLQADLCSQGEPRWQVPLSYSSPLRSRGYWTTPEIPGGCRPAPASRASLHPGSTAHADSSTFQNIPRLGGQEPGMSGTHRGKVSQHAPPTLTTFSQISQSILRRWSHLLIGVYFYSHSYCSWWLPFTWMFFDTFT